MSSFCAGAFTRWGFETAQQLGSLSRISPVWKIVTSGNDCYHGLPCPRLHSVSIQFYLARMTDTSPRQIALRKSFRNPTGILQGTRSTSLEQNLQESCVFLRNPTGTLEHLFTCIQKSRSCSILHSWVKSCRIPSYGHSTWRCLVSVSCGSW